MNGGPERFVLAIALLVPLGISAVSLAQLPGASASLGVKPPFVLSSDAAPTLSLPKRPVSSQAAPPPTLVPPTPTPRPTVAPTVRPTPQPTLPPEPTAVPTPQPAAGKRTYVVQPGDQLKHIAAAYGVNLWSIVAANDIPNPDSLRVGQVLTIPDR